MGFFMGFFMGFHGIYPLVMTNIAMEAMALIEIDGLPMGLPFLKMGGFFHSYITVNNQMVKSALLDYVGFIEWLNMIELGNTNFGLYWGVKHTRWTWKMVVNESYSMFGAENHVELPCEKQLWSALGPTSFCWWMVHFVDYQRLTMIVR